MCALLLLAGGCGAHSRDFRLTDVDAGEAAIAGRMHLYYNGELSTEDCAVCFNGTYDCVGVDRAGFVFYKVPVGRNAFVQVRCERDSSGYHHEFWPKAFRAPAGKVTYIGDIFVEWRTEGGYKLAIPLLGAIGAAMDEAGNDGRARLWVVDNRETVLRAFTQQTGWRGPFHVSLAGQPPRRR